MSLDEIFNNYQPPPPPDFSEESLLHTDNRLDKNNNHDSTEMTLEQLEQAENSLIEQGLFDDINAPIAAPDIATVPAPDDAPIATPEMLDLSNVVPPPINPLIDDEPAATPDMTDVSNIPPPSPIGRKISKDKNSSKTDDTTNSLTKDAFAKATGFQLSSWSQLTTYNTYTFL